MKKITMILLSLHLCFLLASCFEKKDALTKGTLTPTDNFPHNVAVLQGSLGAMWLLSGGKIAAATDDVFSLLGKTNETDLKDTCLVGSMMNPIAEKIIACKIDLVIGNKNIASHTALSSFFKNVGIQTMLFEVETFWDYESVMETFCTLNKRPDLYEKNVKQTRNKIDAIKESILHIADDENRTFVPPKVLLLRASSVKIKTKTSKNMTGAMLKDLHCTNIADNSSTSLEDLSKENIIQEDIDFIFVEFMGQDTRAAQKQLELLLQSKVWKSLPVVKKNNVFILPQDLFHYKPCNKWDIAYKYLFDIIYGNEYGKKS